MSGSKLAVLGLSLLSALILLYGALFASSPILAPDIFSNYHGPVTDKVEPGCFGIPLLLFMIFIAFLPAMAAFRLWRTRVCAQAAQERREIEFARQCEEQILQIMKQAVDLRLTEVSQGNPRDLPEAFASEVRGVVDLWNRPRRERLFRFLSDLGFDADSLTVGDEDRRQLADESLDSAWKRSRPLVVVAVAAWFSLSFLLFIVTVSAGFGAWINEPTRPGKALLGALGCFIPSLITGLAGAGIIWIFFQEIQVARRRQAALDEVQELTLRHCTEMIRNLPHELSGPRESSDAQSVVRALAIAGAANLEGIRREKLLSLLQQSGGLDRDTALGNGPGLSAYGRI
jgi:hypothetical protein